MLIRQESPTRPTSKVILQVVPVVGLWDVICKYPQGYIIMLKPILKCLLQGIDDSTEIKDYLYEDTCEGLLVNYCHCGGRYPGCRDCEDSAHVDALACGLIDAIVRLVNLEKDTVEAIHEMVVNNNDSYDFDIVVMDLDTIGVKIKNAN